MRVLRGAGLGVFTVGLLLGIGGIGATGASGAPRSGVPPGLAGRESFAACLVSVTMDATLIKEATYTTEIHLDKDLDDSSSGAFEFFCPVGDGPYCTVAVKGVYVGAGPSIQVLPRIIINDVTSGLSVAPCAYGDAASATVLAVNAAPVGAAFSPFNLATPGVCTNAPGANEIWVPAGTEVQVHTTCQFSKMP